jgi:hypothetical protein
LTFTAQATEKRIEQAESDDTPMQLINKLDKEKYSIAKTLNTSEAEVATLSSSLESVSAQLRGTKSKQETLDKEAVMEIDSAV